MFLKGTVIRAGHIRPLLAAFGGLLFFPAAILKEYWAYLCIFFVIAAGMLPRDSCQSLCYDIRYPETAERRLNLAQSFNGLGAFISAMFLSKLVLSGAYIQEIPFIRLSGDGPHTFSRKRDAV